MKLFVSTVSPFARLTLVSALAEGADAVRSWRVLAAELRADGAWFEGTADVELDITLQRTDE